MLYTQIENGKAKYLACMIEHFVEQGIIASADATQEELAAVNIVSVPMFTGQMPNDGYKYGLEILQQEDGSWEHEIVKVEITQAQYENNVAVYTQIVKADRDKMIASTDWVVTKSAEEGTQVPQAWKDYRQALRDIPTQEGFPFTVTWPTLPA
jgi:hypothetical protein